MYFLLNQTKTYLKNENFILKQKKTTKFKMKLKIKKLTMINALLNEEILLNVTVNKQKIM